MWSIFKSKNQKEPKSKDICALSFVLKDDEEVYIDCEWTDNSKLTAQDYAKLIFLVNSGYFSFKIIKMFETKAVEDVEHAPFIQEILSNWKTLYDTLEQQQNESLVVNPSDFIKNVKK